MTLPAYYKKKQEQMIAALQKVERISLTSDYWKASNEKTFISLTAHFIENNKLQSANLATKDVTTSHTATNTYC